MLRRHRDEHEGVPARVRFASRYEMEEFQSEAEYLDAGPPLGVTRSKTSKSAESSKAGGESWRLAKVLPGFLQLFRFGVNYTPNYTIEDLEHRIYSIEHHGVGSSRLLQQDGLISIDNDELNAEENEIRSRVVRCFTDRCAKYAAFALILCVLCTLFLAPVSFMWASGWRDLDRPVLILDISLDVLYALYLVLQLNMSFMHPTRRVEVTCRSKILRRWLRDPLYLAMWASTTTYFWVVVCNAPMLINNIKLVRLAHLMTPPDALWLFQDDSRARLGRVLLLLVGCSHWVACVLVWGGGYHELLHERGEESFALTFKGQRLPGTGKLNLYLMALVESIYMMTGALDNPLGEGGARENNLFSLVLVSVFGPIGCIIVAILIAAVCREQALQFALEIRHEENMAFVKRALENLNIPSELQRRVESLHYFQKMSHDVEAFGQLFKKNNLSGPLEDAIRVYLYYNVLCSPFFTSGGPNYLLAVVRVLEDRMYLPGDYVARRGEVGDEMFFINRGELCVLVPGAGDNDDINKAMPIAGHKRKGHYFGEVALVRRILRTAWVRAETYVVVSVLHRSSIEDIWYFFPEERKALMKAVDQTRLRDLQRANRQKWRTAIDKLKQQPCLDQQGNACENGETSTASATISAHSTHFSDSDESEGGPELGGSMRSSSVQRAQSAGRFSWGGGGTPQVRELVQAVQVCHKDSMERLQSQSQRLDVLEHQLSKLVSLVANIPGLPSTKADSAKSKAKKRSIDSSDVGRLGDSTVARRLSALESTLLSLEDEQQNARGRLPNLTE